MGVGEESKSAVELSASAASGVIFIRRRRRTANLNLGLSVRAVSWISEHKAKADEPPTAGEKPGSATAKAMTRAACGKPTRQTRNILARRRRPRSEGRRRVRRHLKKKREWPHFVCAQSGVRGTTNEFQAGKCGGKIFLLTRRNPEEDQARPV